MATRPINLPSGFELETSSIPAGFQLESIEESRMNIPVGFELETPAKPSAIKEIATAFPTGIAKGFMGLGEAFVGVHEALTNVPIIGAWSEKHRLEETAETQEWKANIEKAYKDMGIPHTVAGKALDAVGQAAPLIAGSLATLGVGGIPLAATYGFTTSGGMAWNRAKKENATDVQAYEDMVLEGSIGAILNATYMPKLLKAAKGVKFSTTNFIRLVKSHAWKLAGNEAKNITSDVLNAAFAGSLNSLVQTGGDIVIPGLTRGAWPKTPTGEIDYPAMLKMIAVSGAKGAAVGGLMGTAFGIIGGAKAIAEPSTFDIDSAISKIQARKDLTTTQKSAYILDVESLRKPPAPTIEKPGVTPTTGSPLTDYETKLNDLITEVKQFQTFKPEQAEAMKRELGIRFAAAEDIAKNEPNPRVALAISKGAMKGSLLKQLTPLKEAGVTRIWTEDDVRPFFGAIQDSDLPITQKWDAESVLNKIWTEGVIPAPHEIAACESIFGKRFTDALLEVRQKTDFTKWNMFMETINIPRALLASCDNSAALRQGFLMAFVDPVNWGKNVGRSLRSLVDERYTEFRDIQIRTNPLYEHAKEHGMPFDNMYGAPQERFQSRLAEKIPGIGRFIKGSQRGWTTFLNGLRMDSYAKFVEAWDGTNKTSADYDSLAQFIGHATGHGDIKSFKKLMPALNMAFFAPRWTMSQFQVFGDLVTTTSPVRKIVAGNLIEAAGVSLLTLSLASMIPGVEVQHDPRSSDFGKIKIGNERINFLGTDQQAIRTASQFLTGQIKAAQVGRIYKEERGKILWRFVRSKLAPTPGLITDLMAGETFLGKRLQLTPAGIPGGIYERVMPLFIQDCVDAARYQGFGTMIATAPLAFHGVGVMAYPKTAATELTTLKNIMAQKYYGGKWDEIGPMAQQALIKNNPSIQVQEAAARIEKDDYGFNEKIGKEQKASADYLTKRLSKEVHKEFTNSIIPMVQLSRNLSSDWFLNETRYEEYKRLTSKCFNQILPKLVSSNIYQNLSVNDRREVMTNVMNEVTKTVRQSIVNKANIRDLTKRKDLK